MPQKRHTVTVPGIRRKDNHLEQSERTEGYEDSTSQTSPTRLCRGALPVRTCRWCFSEWTRTNVHATLVNRHPRPRGDSSTHTHHRNEECVRRVATRRTILAQPTSATHPAKWGSAHRAAKQASTREYSPCSTPEAHPHRATIRGTPLNQPCGRATNTTPIATRNWRRHRPSTLRPHTRRGHARLEAGWPRHEHATRVSAH
jgi:hypothetical protein